MSTAGINSFSGPIPDLKLADNGKQQSSVVEPNEQVPVNASTILELSSYGRMKMVNSKISSRAGKGYLNARIDVNNYKIQEFIEMFKKKGYKVNVYDSIIEGRCFFEVSWN
jgi:hypothetical protein